MQGEKDDVVDQCLNMTGLDSGLDVSTSQDGNKSQLSIWDLPEEILIQFLKHLHIKDLLNMCSTHTEFQDLVENNSVIWSTIGFENSWPSTPNMRHFEKAAKFGNVEALIKLGIAYLYNEGLPGDFLGKKITTNGVKAAEMFSQVEVLTPHYSPFTWLFIRPPWAISGSCCKECVFNNMKKYADKIGDPSVQICVAQTLQLLDTEEKQEESSKYLALAKEQGSDIAALLLWKQNWKKNLLDTAYQLHSIRELRDIAALGNLDAQISLCTAYANRKLGGISEAQAAVVIRDFVQASKITNVSQIYKRSELTHSMRYILLDWLVEVANMKDFNSQTLHTAIDVVDRYLKVQRTTRSRLQLLGVSAMVLCSRFLGKDIITIREAAWLTDNTYKYEDVVRMMGEITATLRGNIRAVTSLDYVEMLGKLAQNDEVTQNLAEFICELSLLQSDLGTYRKSEVAASCVLLARLIQKKEYPWGLHMKQCTGFSVEELAKCSVHVHHKCFVQRAMVDHRDVVLQAVKQRYVEDRYCQVSEIKAMSSEELGTMLGICGHLWVGNDLKIHYKETPNLILSPSRHRSRAPSETQSKNCELSHDREQAATPTLESMSESFEEFNTTAISGYEADKEDNGESFMGQNGFDSDNDQSSSLTEMWCGDNQKLNCSASCSDLETSQDCDSSMCGLLSPMNSSKSLPDLELDTSMYTPMIHLGASFQVPLDNQPSSTGVPSSSSSRFIDLSQSPATLFRNTRLPSTFRSPSAVSVYMDPPSVSSLNINSGNGTQQKNGNGTKLVMRTGQNGIRINVENIKMQRKGKRKSSCSLENENKQHVPS